MYKWIRKLHMYAGLFSFTAIMVWGLTGVLGALPGGHGEGPPTVARIAVETPDDLPDQALAERIAEAAALEYASGSGVVERNDAGRLTLRQWVVNGRYDVEYFEPEGVAEVAFRRNTLRQFLSAVHTASISNTAPEPEARAWAFYNEASLWSFGFMTLSGLYLWAASRPYLLWARWTAAAAAMIVVGFWALSR